MAEKVSAKLTVSMGSHRAASVVSGNISTYTDYTTDLGLIKGRDESLHGDLVHNMAVIKEIKNCHACFNMLKCI